MDTTATYTPTERTTESRWSDTFGAHRGPLTFMCGSTMPRDKHSPKPRQVFVEFREAPDEFATRDLRLFFLCRHLTVPSSEFGIMSVDAMKPYLRL
ncbi:hypothetical protein YTPLAS18_40620 [Nitrospira sp.]|nr:hypothetical protein YTPLAS18_40620 [Nitrospira sp.]